MSALSIPFGFATTASEVLEGIDLSGKRAIVTGATSGLGVETARALAGAGAAVTLAVRNVAMGQQVAADIVATTENYDVTVRKLDLIDPFGIHAFSEAWTGHLDILVNNAGIMAPARRLLTAYGQELQFVTNHLGHFCLAVGLRQALAAANGARIVSVSSSAHLRSPVVFGDLNYSFLRYDGRTAYGQSKTANVLFAVGVRQHWSNDGITANSLMPGLIRTRLQRYIQQSGDTGGAENDKKGMLSLKTPEQGAAISVFLAASPLLSEISADTLRTSTKQKSLANTTPAPMASPVMHLMNLMPIAFGMYPWISSALAPRCLESMTAVKRASARWDLARLAKRSSSSSHRPFHALPSRVH